MSDYDHAPTLGRLTQGLTSKSSYPLAMWVHDLGLTGRFNSTLETREYSREYMSPRHSQKPLICVRVTVNRLQSMVFYPDVVDTLYNLNYLRSTLVPYQVNVHPTAVQTTYLSLSTRKPLREISSQVDGSFGVRLQYCVPINNLPHLGPSRNTGIYQEVHKRSLLQFTRLSILHIHLTLKLTLIPSNKPPPLSKHEAHLNNNSAHNSLHLQHRYKRRNLLQGRTCRVQVRYKPLGSG